MTSDSALARSPYYFVGPRPYREREMAAYICREHRRGRALAEIVTDASLERFGGKAVLRSVLATPSLIRALEEDIAGAIREHAAELGKRR